MFQVFVVLHLPAFYTNFKSELLCVFVSVSMRVCVFVSVCVCVCVCECVRCRIDEVGMGKRLEQSRNIDFGMKKVEHS